MVELPPFKLFHRPFYEELFRLQCVTLTEQENYKLNIWELKPLIHPDYIGFLESTQEEKT